MKKIYSTAIIVLALFAATSCDTLKNLPTNTTGGLFSLNGIWQLTATTDGANLVGSTITVYPIAGNATVKTLTNNNTCLRKNDELWKSIKSNTAGGFSISSLSSACNGSTVYKDGIISIVTNDKISVATTTTASALLTQTWEREK